MRPISKTTKNAVNISVLKSSNFIHMLSVTRNALQMRRNRVAPLRVVYTTICIANATGSFSYVQNQY